MIWVKDSHEIDAMRQSGRLTDALLSYLERQIEPGISTLELDEMAERYINKNGGRAAFKNYRGFPKSICTSVNSVVVHGIPGNRVLYEGDIISIDVGICLDGYYSDAARTFPVGKISETAQKLIDTAEACFFAGLSKALDGNRIGDISAAVQSVAEAENYGVVRELVGHGVGRELHEDPDVPNFGTAGRGVRLRKGMTLAIEPMICAGSRRVEVLDDGWTIQTCDGSLAAHYENTVAITDDEAEILTISPRKRKR
ncbi:MAG: type I methionyl aminopeptidase [Clostridia bacterium]|nr:type I methionyl aminopeptidase [Oscillospiraceae bacterium]MBQ7032791.1 type I methionyl aminopeptidase [Clostridia bacterium]